MGKEQEAKLSKAREELGQCRMLFFLSSLALLSEGVSAEEKMSWGFLWLAAFRRQARLTREVLAPIKRGEGLPLTNQEQEERVKNNLGNFAQNLGLSYESGIGVAEFHIDHTKKIQREEGVGRARK